MSYNNTANSDHPATIIFLIDISGSMAAPMPGGKRRIDVAKDAIHTTYSSMFARSSRQGQTHPRYRIGMIAYSDILYDVYGDKGSIVTIADLRNEGIPEISPQKWTNMAKAFRFAAHIIEKDIAAWPSRWLKECPPPLVINLTDAEFTEGIEAPLEPAKRLMEIRVPDGNVLVENIFISDFIKIPNSDPKEWPGYLPNDQTGDEFGDELLKMSSVLPENYARIMRAQGKLKKLTPGALMMFPGVNAEFIRTGFVVSSVSQSQPGIQRVIDRPRWPEYPPDK